MKLGEKVIARVQERNEYFEVGTKRVLYGIYVAAILLVATTLLNYYTAKIEVDNYYFSATNEGEFRKLYKNKEKIHADDFIISWSLSVTNRLFEFSYKNYRHILNRYTNLHFSSEGRKSLIDALTESSMLSLVNQKSLIVSVKTDDDNVLIRKQGVDPKSGVYTWTVIIPAQLIYTESPSLSYVNDVEISLYIKRRSLLEDETGLQISKVLIAIVK